MRYICTCCRYAYTNSLLRKQILFRCCRLHSEPGLKEFVSMIVLMIPNGMISVSAAYNYLFPVNNGGSIAFGYGYSESYGGTHYGIDIHSSDDDTIYAACDGVVEATANSCPHVSIWPTKCEHYNTFGNYITYHDYHSNGLNYITSLLVDSDTHHYGNFINDCAAMIILLILGGLILISWIPLLYCWRKRCCIFGNCLYEDDCCIVFWHIITYFFAAAIFSFIIVVLVFGT